MLRSWHNFLFVSFDPGGLVTVDKPPLALWVQAASAKLFGFSPLSLLLPEAIIGVLAVAALYWVMSASLRPGGGARRRARAGRVPLVRGRLARQRRRPAADPADGPRLRGRRCARAKPAAGARWCGAACSSGSPSTPRRWPPTSSFPGSRSPTSSALPGRSRAASCQLLVAGLAMLAVSFAWIAFVELTPASQRPYVGSSTNNTELGLTFEYNGFGRVEGQAGGPGQVSIRPGAYVPASRERAVDAAARRPVPAEQRERHRSTAGAERRAGVQPLTCRAPLTSQIRQPRAREKNPIPFGGPPRPLRLFGVGLGDQAGWMLPFALFGLLGVALLILLAIGAGRSSSGRRVRRPSAHAEPTVREPAASTRRRSPRPAAGGAARAGRVVPGGGGGAEPLQGHRASLLRLGARARHGGDGRRGRRRASSSSRAARSAPDLGPRADGVRGRGDRRGAGRAAAPRALHGVVRSRAPGRRAPWGCAALLRPAPPGGAGGRVSRSCCCSSRRPPTRPPRGSRRPRARSRPPGPTTTPAPAPTASTRATSGIDRALADYVSTHDPGTRWALLTVASDTAAPMMLFGLNAGALGGYSGTDPAVDGPGLARLVGNREARYVLLGGEYSLRGGNLATRAVLRACTELAPSAWRSPVPYPFGLALFDCAGPRKGTRGGRLECLRLPPTGRGGTRGRTARSRGWPPSGARRPRRRRSGAARPASVRHFGRRRSAVRASTPRTSWSRERSRSSARRSSTAQRFSRSVSLGPNRAASGPGRACPCGGSGRPGRSIATSIGEKPGRPPLRIR